MQTFKEPIHTPMSYTFLNDLYLEATTSIFYTTIFMGKEAYMSWLNSPFCSLKERDKNLPPRVGIFHECSIYYDATLPPRVLKAITSKGEWITKQIPKD